MFLLMIEGSWASFHEVIDMTSRLHGGLFLLIPPQNEQVPLSFLLLLSCFSRVQLCATPLDGSPPGSAVPGILQAGTLERVAIAFSIV